MPGALDKSDVLDLPPLDGEGDLEDAELPAELLDEALVVAEADPFDDATGEDSPFREVEEVASGDEAGWLLDSDEAGTLDVGGFDLSFAEAKVLEDDEADGAVGFDDLVLGDETVTADSGEEGPLADDEELREEDLPALDADEDGDVADDDLYDRSLLGEADELRWDDRAWARVPTADDDDESDDSGVLAILGEEVTRSPRDATWRKLEETGRVMAAAYVPGDSVVLALATADRTSALLVRVQPDGTARIIAEVEPRLAPGADDEGEPCLVAFLGWDASRGCLVVSGNFGAQAFAPTRVEATQAAEHEAPVS